MVAEEGFDVGCAVNARHCGVPRAGNEHKDGDDEGPVEGADLGDKVAAR